ncbi:MAG: MarR family transcriptional regulator [Candidatus Thorarchaeota archaeon]
MKHFLILLIISSFIFPLFISTMSSAQIEAPVGVVMDPVEITTVMYENGTTAVHIDALSRNMGSSPISNLVFNIESLEIELIDVLVDEVNTTATTMKQDRYTVVSILLLQELAENESIQVHIELTATDLQSNTALEEGGTYYNSDFLFYVRPINDFRNLTIRVVLPQHASLSQDSVVPVYPNPDTNSTDGFTLIFSWDIPVLRVGQEKVFIVKYRTPNTAPAQADVVYALQLVSILLGIVLGVFLTITGPRLVTRLRNLGSVRVVGVTSEEDEVLDVLRQKGGSCSQKDLYVELDMSQSKVSIILTNLEERGLVKRFREGRENVVHVLDE